MRAITQEEALPKFPPRTCCCLLLLCKPVVKEDQRNFNKHDATMCSGVPWSNNNIQIQSTCVNNPSVEVVDTIIFFCSLRLSFLCVFCLFLSLYSTLAKRKGAKANIKETTSKHEVKKKKKHFFLRSATTSRVAAPPSRAATPPSLQCCNITCYSAAITSCNITIAAML